MQKYEQNLAANTSGALRPLSGASVVVTDSITGLPASLYSDNGVTVLAQPLVTDNDGYFGFYAPDGKYSLTFTGPRFADFVREIVLEDPEDNPYATLAQLAAPTGSNLVRHGEALVSEVLDDVLQQLEELDAGLSYELPMASAGTLGGIKLGANLVMDDAGAVSVAVTNDVAMSKLTSLARTVREATLPDKSGTLAMLSDIPTQQAWAVLVDVTVTPAMSPIAMEWPTIFGDNPQYSDFVLQVDAAVTKNATNGSLTAATRVVTLTTDGANYIQSNLGYYHFTRGMSGNVGSGSALPLGSGVVSSSTMRLRNVQAAGSGAAGSLERLAGQKAIEAWSASEETPTTTTTNGGPIDAYYGSLNPNVDPLPVKGLRISLIANTAFHSGRFRIFGVKP